MKTTKNILIIFTIFASLIYLITGCKDESAQPIEKIKVSNISSEEERTICRDKLIESGLEEKRVDKFMEMVKSYNEDVNGELPYKNGFVETENIKTDYTKTVDEFYKTENKIGSNCRINTFELLLGNIEIKRVKSDNTSTLDFDKSSLENEFPELFTKDETTKFETYFAPVKAKISTDKKDQIAEIKKAVNSRGIKWNDKIDAKIISVWFHNDDEIDGNILFIGHTGKYSDGNCGPTSMAMILKWLDPNSTATGESLRDEIPNDGDWWTTNIFDSYFESNNMNIEDALYKSPETITDLLNNGDIVLVCIKMGEISPNRNPNSSNIGRFYGFDGGHFLLIKGYRIVDGKLYYEVYDPNNWDMKYDNGEPMGKDRLYLATEMDKAITTWWSGIYGIKPLGK